MAWPSQSCTLAISAPPAPIAVRPSATSPQIVVVPVAVTATTVQAVQSKPAPSNTPPAIPAAAADIPQTNPVAVQMPNNVPAPNVIVVPPKAVVVADEKPMIAALPANPIPPVHDRN